MGDMPETSVIIRARNEEKYLPALFDGLATQSYRDFETVMVDSGSSDRTVEIARQRADRLTQVDPHQFTFGRSLNVGIRNSVGRYIAIVSAHAAPVDGNWLIRLIEPLREARTAMAYGRQKGRAESKFSERMDFERAFGAERRTLRPPNFFANNANSAVRRDLWDQHPFDERLPGLEDIEWARHWMERGYHVIYEPEAAIYHIHTETWGQVRHRYFREGQAGGRIGVRNRGSLPREVWREVIRLFGDILAASKRRQLREKAVDIVRFRLEKLVGTLCGVWNGTRGQAGE